jgi:hypothetical protein
MYALMFGHVYYLEKIQETEDLDSQCSYGKQCNLLKINTVRYLDLPHIYFIYIKVDT